MTERSDDAGLSGEFFEGTAEIIGAAVGATLGTIAGPVGIAAGATGGVVITRALTRVGSELAERLLGPRQKLRIGGAYLVAAERIRARTDAGELVRDDWTAQVGGDERTDAEETLEGVLLAAANAYEERKVRYLGELYASIAFRPDIGRAYASLVVRVAESLSYRQLVVLAFLGTRADHERALSILDVQREESGRWQLADGLEEEMAELSRRNLLGYEQADGSVPRLESLWGTGGASSFTELKLGRLALTPFGNQLHDLMRLADVPAGDRDELLRVLGAETP